MIAGEIVAGRLVRLACERHLRDLREGPARGLKWDPGAARSVIDFFAFLRLPDSGKPFVLQPWQEFIVGNLFGWKGPDGYRRFRAAFIEVGKGNGKTVFSGAVGLYGLVADGELAAEIYAAATTREQASICFRDARRLAETSPAIARRLDIGQHNIAHLPSGSFFRPVSSEHRGLDGKRVHMGLIDEVHEHPTAMVVDKVRAGTKGRRQGLIVEITNSGHDRTSVCWQHHQYSADILEGRLENDSWFAYVCQLDPCPKCRAEGKLQPTDGCPQCDDWRDPRTWIKANPGLDVILPSKYLEEQVREAQGMPAKESIVKRLNFCTWVEAAVHAVPMDKWDACKRSLDLESLRDRDCFAGLDIGATSDFTAFVQLFPHDDEEVIEVPPSPDDPAGQTRRLLRRSYTLLPHFWLPERSRRRDANMAGVIAAWRRQGLVRTTPGDVVDYDQVLEEIAGLTQLCNLRSIAMDRGFQGAQMATNLMARFGPVVVAVPQGILSMNAPFREFVELVIQGRIHHDGQPVLRWMVANTAAETRGGLIKPSKEHSTEKIDGVTAAVMALSQAMVWVPSVLYYDEHELEMA